MSGEPTAAELQRELDRLRTDVLDRLADLRTEVRTLKQRVVFADVYAADERRREAEKLADERRRDNEKEAAKAEREAAQTWRSNRDANRKWILAAILLPIGSTVVEIIAVVRGVR